MNLKEAEHYPAEVLKATPGWSKEQASREDDRRSTRRSGKPLRTVADKSDETNQYPLVNSPEKSNDKNNLECGVEHVRGGRNLIVP